MKKCKHCFIIIASIILVLTWIPLLSADSPEAEEGEDIQEQVQRLMDETPSEADTMEEQARFDVIFTDAPVGLVLNYLSMQSGKSVNASQNIKGRISVNLTDVTVDRAVENIATSYGWKMIQPDANTYMLVTEAEHTEWQRTQTIDRVFEVNHVEASEAAQLFQTRLSEVGTLAADDRTGKIFVTDLAKNIEEMANLLLEIDVPVITRVFQLEHSLPANVERQIRDYLSKRGKLSIDERTRQIVVSDLQENIRKIENLIKEIDFETELRIFRIKYLAETDERRELDELRQAIEPLLTPQESYFEIDKRTNIIIVRDIPAVLDRVGEVIDAYDQPPRQVFIVARLFRVKVSDQLELGTEFQRVWGGDQRLESRSGIEGHFPGDDPQFRDRMSFFSFSEPRSRLVFMDLDRFELAVKMMSEMTDSELLIAPQLLVKHQQKARIMSGGEEPYRVIDRRTRDYDRDFYTQRTIDYGVRFEVTPHIHHNGLIDMEVWIENSTPQIRGTEESPLVGRVKDEMETSITIPSGKAVMMGGMIDEDRSRETWGVPYLNRIPVIGSLLFGGRRTGFEKRELFLFLAPRVVDFDQDFYDEFIELQSYDEVKEGTRPRIGEERRDFDKAMIEK